MKPARAILYGVIGAGAMSVLSAILRTAGFPIRMELLLGSLTGASPAHAETLTYLVGLGIHLVIGGALGLFYGWLFERVWSHGGAGVGMIFGLMHAAMIGMLFGLTPQFDSLVPSQLPAPGAYFSAGGPLTVLAFFALHVMYGAIVGAGYGHTTNEREWAPEGRL